MPKDKKSQWTASHFGPDVRAALFVALRQIVVLERDQPNVEDEKQVILVINPSARGIDLSNWTVPELDAFKHIVNQAIELARPYCIERDAEAEEARKRNDVRHKRIWRAPPRYIDFTKEKEPDAEPTNNQRLPSGPDKPWYESEHDQGIQG